jgi:hypothetical protein
MVDSTVGFSWWACRAHTRDLDLLVVPGRVNLPVPSRVPPALEEPDVSLHDLRSLPADLRVYLTERHAAVGGPFKNMLGAMLESVPIETFRDGPVGAVGVADPNGLLGKLPAATNKHLVLSVATGRRQRVETVIVECVRWFAEQYTIRLQK